MYLLILGLILLGVKLSAWGPGASLPWWGVAIPFVLAVVWWQIADWTGYSSHKASERQQREVEKRRIRRVKVLARKQPPRR